MAVVEPICFLMQSSLKTSMSHFVSLNINSLIFLKKFVKSLKILSPAHSPTLSRIVAVPVEGLLKDHRVPILKLPQLQETEAAIGG